MDPGRCWFLAILESMIEIDPDHRRMDEQQRAEFAAADTEQPIAMIAPEMPAQHRIRLRRQSGLLSS